MSRAGAVLSERRLGTMPWLTVTGPRQACFHALGAHAAEVIGTVVATLPQLQALRRHVGARSGRSRFDAVVKATVARLPVQMEEMAALAAGAGVDVETVLLLNLRGDLGDPRAGGCSDIAVPGDRWVLGHNEDGDALFAAGISALTLQADADRPVFALWYPGMLPSNAFTLNDALAWGIDHVPAREVVVGPARHAVARALQQVETLDAAADFLDALPSAGGFAYNFAERATGRVATVEAGGGAGGLIEPPHDRTMLWHTNHLRRPGRDGGAAGPSSCARGEVLASVAEQTAGSRLGRDRVLEVLTTPLPGGVRAVGPSMTLCTVVVDGAACELTLVPAGGVPARVSLDQLLA